MTSCFATEPNLAESAQVLNRALSVNVKRLRTEQGLSQRQLSNICGFSRHLLTNIEYGATDCRLSTVKRLADALGVTPYELLRRPTDLK